MSIVYALEAANDEFPNAFVSALEENSSVKSVKSTDGFRLGDRSSRGISDEEWNQLFATSLLDKSSIIATFSSNYSLQSIKMTYRFLSRQPGFIYSLLHVTRNPNKFDVAREKILDNHYMGNVKFVPASLPVALSWVGDTLGNVYDILRRVPHMIQNNGKKRKLERIE